LERAHLALGDWRDIRARLADTEARMCTVMDEARAGGLGYHDRRGLAVIGAAAILAETGDPGPFATPRALVKHAGLCPRDNSSGAAQGKTSISGRGRPGLRLAAWRAVWAAMPNHPVMAARFAYLTTRQDNRRPASPHCLRGHPAALDPRRGHPACRQGPAIAAGNTSAQRAA
jgi:transposase